MGVFTQGMGITRLPSDGKRILERLLEYAPRRGLALRRGFRPDRVELFWSRCRNGEPLGEFRTGGQLYPISIAGGVFLAAVIIACSLSALIRLSRFSSIWYFWRPCHAFGPPYPCDHAILA